MDNRGKEVRKVQRFVVAIISSIILTALYAAWTHNLVPGNIAVIFVLALIISIFFAPLKKLPPVSPKRIAYAVAYIPYLFLAIVRANLDVASRVVKRKIPLNPGIVEVKTTLKSSIAKTILANSITLTPGTLSVEISGDKLFIHWIDVKDVEEKGASEKIVSGFERFLEVIFE